MQGYVRHIFVDKFQLRPLYLSHNMQFWSFPLTVSDIFSCHSSRSTTAVFTTDRTYNSFIRYMLYMKFGSNVPFWPPRGLRLKENRVPVACVFLHMTYYCFFFLFCFCFYCFLNWTQRAHNVEMTFNWRRCNVKTSYWRQYNVISTSCACWEGVHFWEKQLLISSLPFRRSNS